MEELEGLNGRGGKVVDGEDELVSSELMVVDRIGAEISRRCV